MIAPIGLIFEILILVKDEDCRSALYNTAIVGNGYFGRGQRQYMHMIWFNTHFNYLDLFLLRKGPDTVPNLVSDCSCEYPVAVFGYPNDMVLPVPNGMC